MKTGLILFWFLICFCGLRAQKQDNIWPVGVGKVVDFNFSPPQVFSKANVSSFEGGASICSPTTGQLLFACASALINRNYQPMPNGNGAVKLGSSTSQGVQIVPFVDSPGKYYVFSLYGFTNSGTFSISNPSAAKTTGRLYYSVVDMNLDNGLGDVVPGRKAILIDSNLSEAMIAVPGCNNNIWLLVHGRFGSTTFKAFEITSKGFNPVAVISTVGSLTDSTAYWAGCMSASPDGKKIALCSYFGAPGGIGCELFDFDQATGTLANNILMVDPQYAFVYDACFSPDNNKLYVSGWSGVSPAILQYDISTFSQAAIMNSVYRIDPGGPIFKMTLLGNEIYIAQLGRSHLGRIDYPNILGQGCHYDSLAIPAGAELNLPDNIVYAKTDRDTSFQFHDIVECTKDLKVQLTAPPGYHSYLWENGSHDTIREIVDSGVYWIIADKYCTSKIDSFKVRNIDVSFSLGPDTVFCNKESYTLQVNVPGAQYLWRDGSTRDSLTITQSGEYFVTAKNEGCNHIDTVNVRFIRIPQPYLGDSAVVCSGESITLSVDSGLEDSVIWSNGSHNRQTTISNPGMITVSIKNDFCVVSDTFSLFNILCDCSVNVPNAFTPNNDGLNDLFRPVIDSKCPVRGFVLNVYNRWGELISSTRDISKGWDGKYKGVPADVGTYMYTMQLEYGLKYRVFNTKGDFILVR